MRGEGRAFGLLRGVVATACLVCTFVLSSASTASADTSICTSGSGAGQCANPSAVAVDSETGTVFVADTGNNRIDVFEPDGSFLRAFGWDVIPSGQPGDTGIGLEVCTAASTCKAGSAGNGAGQFNEGPTAIAVDNSASPAHHDVYAFDGPNLRMQRFHPSGEFVLGFGSAGTGTGQFDRDDNPIAVGPDGVVYVGGQDASNQARVQEFEATGAFVKQILLVRDECDEGKASNLVPLKERAIGLAIDAAGNFYFAENGGGGVRKYDSSGNLLTPCPTIDPSFNLNAIALDGAGNLFVADSTPFGQGGGAETAIYQFDPAGAPIHTLYGNGTLRSRPLSLAPYSDAGGDLFVVEGLSPRRVLHIALEPPGPVVLPVAAHVGDDPVTVDRADSKATQIGNLTATLNAKVNPEGKASTVHFEYVDDASYQEDISNGGDGFAGPNTVVTAESASVGTDFKAHEAHFDIPCAGPGEPGCLAGETVYHFRAVASNADAPGGRKGPEATFETLPPIQLGPAWATAVGTDSAKLHAELNPTGVAAVAHFEYVDEAAYEEDISNGGDGFGAAVKTPDVDGGASPLDFGAGSVALSREALAFPLITGTTYHYRYTAEDFFGEFASPERTLTTLPTNPQSKQCPNQAFRGGASGNLPDCRAYELVSPLDKAGGDIVNLKEITLEQALGVSLARVDQAAPGGEALAYAAFRAFGDALSAPWSSQYIARRSAAGWSTHSVNPPTEGPSLYGGLFAETPFKGFSEDLCSAWFLQYTDLALVAGAPAGVESLYRRKNCGEEGYELITPVAPTQPPPGFGGDPSNYLPTLGGFSADGTISAFKAPAKMTPEASDEDIYQAYLYQGGSLRLLSVLPGGEAANTHASVGTAQGPAGKRNWDSVFHAVSDDGSRVFWSAGSEEPPAKVHELGAAAGTGPSRLYLRLNATQPQSALAQISGAGKLKAGSNTVESLVAAKGKGNLTAGSTIATAVSPEVGRFQAGQPISAAGGKIPDGTTILTVQEEVEPGKFELTLSAAASSSGTATTLTSRGPAPFAVGQPIAGTGIPAGTTITAAAEGTLTLTKAATVSETGVPLTATTGCTEAEKACTLQISEGVGTFLSANPTATRAIYSEGGDLYAFDVAKAIAHEAAKTLIAHKVSGILGASEDARRVYLVSEDVCSGTGQNSEGEKAQAGKLNVYLYEEGEECGTGDFAFVARLLSQDTLTGDGLSFASQPGNHRARVSGDGLHAVFMSRAPLTSYDNADANNGEADAEVFLYDAEGGRLRCVSCNPSGARPVGKDVRDGVGIFAWASGQIPAWENQWHASRVLSADGRRLFFESFDGLVSRDTNGQKDVYEWERAKDKEECVGEIGGELFDPRSDGCLSLISSGKGGIDAELLDASISGSDVFFSTGSSLVASDYGLVDVYDAREGGGLPEPAEPKPPCEGEACQSPPAAPSDPTPASSSFEGEGNVQEGKKPKRHKGKRHKHKHNKHQRRHHRAGAGG